MNKLKQMHGDKEVQERLGREMYPTPDRRAKPRVVCDYPAIVEGYDAQGGKYKEDARLANLSAGGLYMWVNRNIEKGARLSVTIYLSNTPIDDEMPKLAISGIVMRTEPKYDGTLGVAMKFDHYRFQ